MTRSEQLAHQLAQACSGRENHADLFHIAAERQPGGRAARLYWVDAFTGQSGLLGTVGRREVAAVVRTLFPQLRQWRTRCENRPARAKGAAA